MTTKLDALRTQMEALQAQLKREEGKEAARKEVTALVEKLGYTVEELFYADVMAVEQRATRGRKPRTPDFLGAALAGKKEPSPVKYRKGEGQQWSGKGRRPQWVSEILDAGGSLDEYLVG